LSRSADSRIRRILLLFTLLSTSCQRAPSVDILGSFFPIWLFCIAFGIVLTVVAWRVFVKVGIEDNLGPRALVYPSLSLLFAFLIWLIFFR
jgi:hypothetical protein